MKNKTKILSLLLVSIIVFSTFIISGCSTTRKSIEKSAFYDGAFRYYYVEDEGVYAIVGDKEDENPSTMYIPSHYNGTEIKYFYYEGSENAISSSGYWGPSLKNVMTVYFPYNSMNKTSLNSYRETSVACPLYTFYLNTDTGVDFINLYVGNHWLKFDETQLRTFFTTKKIYEQYLNYINNNQYQNYVIIDHNGYITEFLVPKFSLEDFCLGIANTSFMFNYENCPNEGYFFIDEFSRGGKLQRRHTSLLEKDISLTAGLKRLNV